ncbi:MAG: NAD(P)H-dependent oxidoreductase [Chloroflexota bacterium]
MKVLIISCSLNPNSHSFILATQTKVELEQLEVDTQLIDLRELPLEMAGAPTAWGTPNTTMLGNAIEQADAVLMAVPIYNFDVNAAAKNVIEVTGSVWNDKLVGFLCAAGGNNSYMSIIGIANSLMLDFRCIVIPRFVYANRNDFSDGAVQPVHIQSTEIETRVKELAETTAKLAEAFQDVMA